MTKWKTKQSEVSGSNDQSSKNACNLTIFLVIIIWFPSYIPSLGICYNGISCRYTATILTLSQIAIHSIWNLHCFRLLPALANSADCLRALSVLLDGILHPRHQGLNCPVPCGVSFRLSKGKRKLGSGKRAAMQCSCT